jgi:hypothetical protein
MTVYHGFGPEHVRAIERAIELTDAIERAGFECREMLHADDLKEVLRLIGNLLEATDNTRWSRKAEA